jgi:alkyl hydroperoxide reductase subunit AhpC
MSDAARSDNRTTALRVGAAAPPFDLQTVEASREAPRRARLSDYRGRWLAVIFYPRDFSFVCPTELTAFSARMSDFRDRGCELLGVSVDSLALHREWFATAPAAGGLGPLQFPLASDPKGEAARAYGVWDAAKRVSQRGLFIVDPEGVLQYAVVHNLSVGRSADEVLRVLGALQTGGLCPASWTAADGVIDPESALRPGRVVAHYRVRAKLGSGTFGTVFGAWDLHLERPVALKVLRRSIAESREALLNEARAAARVNHPHVCTIYAVEEADGLPLIVMEQLEGRALSQMIPEPLDEALALALAAQVASGLAAAHLHEVVHGDFKPANVMVSAAGIAKILDFGLSRAHRRRTAQEAKSRLTRQQTAWSGIDFSAAATLDVSLEVDDRGASVRGTPAYMSPEQASGEPATPASDAFSFGLTLFEMLTGRPAHEKLPVIQLLERVRAADLAAELAPRAPAPRRKLLAALLARDPGLRPSMADVAAELAR